MTKSFKLNQKFAELQCSKTDVATNDQLNRNQMDEKSELSVNDDELNDEVIRDDN